MIKKPPSGNPDGGFYLAFNGKLIFSDTTQQAYPVVRQILKSRSRCDPVIRIADCRSHTHIHIHHIHTFSWLKSPFPACPCRICQLLNCNCIAGRAFSCVFLWKGDSQDTGFVFCLHFFRFYITDIKATGADTCIPFLSQNTSFFIFFIFVETLLGTDGKIPVFDIKVNFIF